MIVRTTPSAHWESSVRNMEIWCMLRWLRCLTGGSKIRTSSNYMIWPKIHSSWRTSMIPTRSHLIRSSPFCKILLRSFGFVGAMLLRSRLVDNSVRLSMSRSWIHAGIFSMFPLEILTGSGDEHASLMSRQLIGSFVMIFTRWATFLCSATTLAEHPFVW